MARGRTLTLSPAAGFGHNEIAAQGYRPASNAKSKDRTGHSREPQAGEAAVWHSQVFCEGGPTHFQTSQNHQPNRAVRKLEHVNVRSSIWDHWRISSCCLRDPWEP